MKDQEHTPLSEPFANLFPKLQAANLISKMARRAAPKYLLKYYDHNAQCQYHSHEIEHNVIVFGY